MNLFILLQIPKHIAIQYPDIYKNICIRLYVKNSEYFWEYYFFVHKCKHYTLLCSIYSSIKDKNNKLYYSTMHILIMEYKRRKKQTNTKSQEQFNQLLLKYNLLSDLHDSIP